MTKVISFLGEKGGSGRTNTLCALAPCAKTALIIDMDSASADAQHAHNWATWRKETVENSKIESIATVRQAKAIEALENTKADYVFIDFAGHDTSITYIDLIRRSDLIIVPFLSDTKTIRANIGTIDICRNNNLNYRALHIIDSQKKASNAFLEEQLNAVNAEQFKTKLRKLEIYNVMYDDGQSPVDTRNLANALVRAEIKSLWKEIERAVK